MRVYTHPVSDATPPRAEAIDGFPEFHNEMTRAFAWVRFTDEIVPYLRLGRRWDAKRGAPLFVGQCPACGAWEFHAVMTATGVGLSCSAGCTVDEIKRGFDRTIKFRRQAELIRQTGDDDLTTTLDSEWLENLAESHRPHARVNVERREREVAARDERQRERAVR